MAYTPSQAPGPLSGVASTSVVSATDSPLKIASPDDMLQVLNQILVAVNALSGTKGVAADLRVTPTGLVTVGQATAANLNTNVGAIANMGSNTISANTTVANWTNSVAQDAFNRNIVRN
jgi:hypothetical protein